MNILFVLYHDFSTASAIHVHNFANLLVEQGHSCVVTVPENKDSVHDYLGDRILYTPCEFSESLDGTVKLFQGEEADIIHAWTPREVVRKQSERLLQKYSQARLIVHLEDNEEMIVESFAQIPYRQLQQLQEDRLSVFLPDLLASPVYYPLFLERAAAVTVITEELLDFVPGEKKHLRLWPVIDLASFSPEVDGKGLRSKLGFSDDEFVLCYVGSVHGVNAAEVRSLYLAVYLANCIGIPTRLVRAGRDVVDFLGDAGSELRQYVKELGYIQADEVPLLMAGADLLLQPGNNDRFNRYRLPSKIPEFLASGRPVAVPRANIGLQLRDGEDALIMERGDANSIVVTIQTMYHDKALARKLGAGGRAFAEKNFSGKVIYEKLIEFYQDILV